MSCAGQQRGSNTSLLVGTESTFGTAAISFAVVPILSESLTANRAQNDTAVIRGDRNPSRPFQGNTTVSGTIVVPIDVNNFPTWLGYAIGSGGSISATDCLDSFTVKVNMSDIPRCYTFTGCKVQSLSMSLGGDGELQASIEVVGQSYSDSATLGSGSAAAYIQYRPLDVSIDEGGAASSEFLSLDVEINNNIDTENYAIDGTGQVASLPEGIASVGGSGTILYDNQTIYDKADAATESSIQITFARGMDTLVINMAEIEYGLNTPQIEGPQGVTATYDYKAFYDDGAGTSAITFT